jgi:hypothetical protein
MDSTPASAYRKEQKTMAEIPDVIPGDPIEASWGNPIRDRSLQRYLSAADRDAKNPVPVDGDMAFLIDSSTTQVFGAGNWNTIVREADGDALWLRLDATNGPLLAGLGILGNLEIRKDLTMTSPDGVTNGYKISPNVSDVADFGLVFRKLDNTELAVLTSAGILTLSLPTTAGVRNVLQGTVDPGPGDGIDGDVWLTYS